MKNTGNNKNKKSNPYRILSKIATTTTSNSTQDTTIENNNNTDRNYNSEKTSVTVILPDITNTDKSQNIHVSNLEFTKDKLQEAIIWSEIVGKPLCKRRKRRSYGN